MFCSNCGERLDENARFCPSCGNPISKEIKLGQAVEENKIKSSRNTVNNSKKPHTRKRKKTKKPFYRKKRFWFIVIFIVLIIIGANNIDDSETKDDGNTDKTEANNSEKSETILSAVAKDANDLTGTYEDTDMSMILTIIIHEDGLATYKLGYTDISEADIETNCVVESTYIAGKYSYIVKNMDGSLGISSGVGEPWGNFVKIDDKAVIDLAEMENSDELTYDFVTDVEMGLLYCDAIGVIVDSNGKAIEEYNYIKVVNQGMVSNGEHILEGYHVNNNSQLYYEAPGEWDYDTGSGVYDTVIPKSGIYKNENSPYVFRIENDLYSYEGNNTFVYVTLYCYIDGDDYEQEYTGMINLYNPGNMTIMTGVQSAAYIEYDNEIGMLSGTGVSTLVNDYRGMHEYYWLHTLDAEYYEDNEVTEYYWCE